MVFDSSYQKIYKDFCDNTKKTFYLNALAIFLIFIFLVGPLQTSGFTNILIKILILYILSYSLYVNAISSKTLFDIENIFTKSNLEIVRNNFLLNSTFSLCLFGVIVYLLFDIFK